jgi:S1-C subfamily serine protease
MKENLWGKTIRASTPAIVTIVISKNAKALKKDMAAEMMALPPYAQEQRPPDIPPEAVDAHGMVKIGSGSGFFVDPSGIILTNKHVIADANAEYAVITDDDTHYEAVVLARDPINDVAILKIDISNAPVLALGNSDAIALGEPVLAIGNALGLFKNTVSSGIVSGLARAIQAAPDPKAGMAEMRGLIQTDTAINPGNSGGPLFNADSQVIGINAAIVFGAQNLSFSIPINTAKRDIDDVKKYGRVRRPLLGLRYLIIDPTLQEKMKLPVDYGVIVMGHGASYPGVLPKSPAAKAGLKEKDIIIDVDGVKIENGKTPQDFLDDKEVGDVLRLTVIRNGKTIKADITLEERK